MEQAYIDYLKEATRYASKQEIESICFKAFIDSYQRVKLIEGIEKLIENRIRDLFIIDLEEHNHIIKHALDNYIIRIIPESYDPQKGKRSDIQFILPILKRDLVFECKRLLSADSRYLNEGLIRFIKLEYAAKENDAGMIGFVINPKDFSRMISKLRDKLLVFHCSKLIDKPVLGHQFSFQSIHIRIDSREILISHLFFKF